jgi:hypothetical protein
MTDIAGMQNALRSFGARRYFEIGEATRAIVVRDIGVRVLAAIGYVESRLTQAISATDDRGVFQVNPVHDDWLASQPGCPAGSWTPEPGKTALAEGYVPALAPAAAFAKGLLGSARAYAVAHKVPSGKVLRFSIAAYNAGIGGAWKGYQEGDVDKYTTGHDYSARVLAAWADIVSVTDDWGWF